MSDAAAREGGASQDPYPAEAGSEAAARRTPDPALPGGPSRLELPVLLVLLAVAVATLAYGWFEGRQKGLFGTATPPFVFGWLPMIDVPWAVACAAVLGLGAVAAPTLVRARLSPPVFAIVLFGLAAAAGLTIGAARMGTYGWWQVFDLRPQGSFEAANEYLPGLPLLEWGIPHYLDRFAETVPSQAVNIAGHPPGPLLLMRWAGLETAERLAALCIGCAALTAPLTYWIGRSAGVGERAARIAGLLAVFTPVMLLDGVTSFDAVYAAMGALAAALLLSRRPLLLALGGLVFAVCTIFSWALLGVGAAVALTVLWRDGWRRALLVALVSGAGFVGINAVLAVGWGYDPIGTLLATEGVYRNSLAQIRPYRFWVFGSPVAWALMLGPVVIAAATRAALRRNPVALGILAVVVIAAVAGFTKAETERIWLIFVPLACVAAAPVLSTRRLPLVLGVLGAQALALQVLVDTVW
jgi:hypothetical protein